MHFFTVEVFQPFLERLLPGVSCEDIFKVTVISDNYDFDIQAHHEVQDILNEMLTSEEQEDIAVEFSEDFFPTSLCYEEEEEEEDEEEFEELSYNENYEIAIDGLPRIERNLTINDFIQATYTLGDLQMEALQVRINILISPEAASYIDFDTIKTVH